MCDMKRTEMEARVLAVFAGRGGLTEGDVKGCFPGENDKRWVRSVLTKLYMRKELERKRRFNREKYCAELVYFLPKNI